MIKIISKVFWTIFPGKMFIKVLPNAKKANRIFSEATVKYSTKRYGSFHHMHEVTIAHLSMQIVDTQLDKVQVSNLIACKRISDLIKQYYS